MTSNGKGPHGKKSVVLGIANEYSIAYEDVFHEELLRGREGAVVALTVGS